MADNQSSYHIAALDLAPGFSQGESQKYIIRCKDGVYFLYSAPLPYHADIADGYGIPDEEVIGGGRIVLERGKVVLFGESSKYGPEEVTIRRNFQSLVAEEWKRRS